MSTPQSCGRVCVCSGTWNASSQWNLTNRGCPFILSPGHTSLSLAGHSGEPGTLRGGSQGEWTASYLCRVTQWPPVHCFKGSQTGICVWSPSTCHSPLRGSDIGDGWWGWAEGLGGGRRAFLSSLPVFLPAGLCLSPWSPSSSVFPRCPGSVLLYPAPGVLMICLCIYLKLIITEDTPMALMGCQVSPVLTLFLLPA